MRPHHWLHLNRCKGNQPPCPVIAFIRSLKQQPNYRSQGSSFSCREAPVYGSGCACTLLSRAIVMLMCHPQVLQVLLKKVTSFKTALLMSLTHCSPLQFCGVWAFRSSVGSGGCMYSHIHIGIPWERWDGMGWCSVKAFYIHIIII